MKSCDDEQPASWESEPTIEMYNWKTREKTINEEAETKRNITSERKLKSRLNQNENENERTRASN